MALLAFILFESYAIDYHIQLILPMNSQEAAKYQQWASVARYAASEYSSRWPSGNSLIVDVLDYEGDFRKLATIGTAAMLNASVVGIMGDDLMTDKIAAFISAAEVRSLSSSFPGFPSDILRSLPCFSDANWLF